MFNDGKKWVKFYVVVGWKRASGGKKKNLCGEKRDGHRVVGREVLS